MLEEEELDYLQGVLGSGHLTCEKAGNTIDDNAEDLTTPWIEETLTVSILAHPHGDQVPP